MHKFLAAAALTLALICHAHAGDTSCRGTVVVGPEWTTVEDEATVPLPKDHPRYAPNSICRFKTESPLGKRILAKCPNGSQCEISLSIANKPKDYVASGQYNEIWTIVKWPEGGVRGPAKK
jgi:hypothetical protein